MPVSTTHPRLMPDVAHAAGTPVGGTLGQVGMSAIEVPVRLRDDTGTAMLCPARADAYVSLADPAARGIHMSRLFLSLQSILAEEDLSCAAIRQVVTAFLGSHHGLSDAAYVHLGFDLLVRRPALKSANTSWRTYPVTISGAIRDGRFTCALGVRVAYSSTCPCSAALSRQLIQERFRADHAGRAAISTEDAAEWLGLESSFVATPHSQRSYATVDVRIADPAHAPSFVEVIDRVEGALKTAVQAAVKREDEQEFARLNGTNLMFCEDAGRRIKAALDADARIADFRIEARHVESLHPHDAVSRAVKGIPGGLDVVGSGPAV
jgi:GTP cyclohydrolase IB